MSESAPSPQQNDADLMRRVSSDPNAIAELYDRHAHAVLSLLAQRHSHEVAADLTAETFCTVLVHAGRYNPARGTVLGWIFGVAMNKSADYWRAQAVDRRAMARLRIDPPNFGTDALERVHERLEAEASSAALAHGLAALSSAERALLEALIVDELSAAEYAAKVGSRPATIRKRLQRTLAAVRLNMQESR